VTDELHKLEEQAARQGRKGFYGPSAVILNERILELDSGNVSARLRLARCHSEAGNWLGAHECYRQLLALGVGDAALIDEKLKETRSRAAQQLEAERRAEAAAREQEERTGQQRQQFVEEASAIVNFVDARTLAIAARDSREYPRALVYHERSLELAISKGDRTGALAAHAATLRRAGHPAEALVVLRESIELEPSRERNKPSYTSLVATLRELDELDEARREGESLLQLYADDSWVLFALGGVFKALFQRDRDAALLDQAQTYYQRASELKPGERNMLAELRSLVELYDALSQQLREPEMAMKARELERHIARLQPRHAAHPS
jgi:tetratricopeptide (TPR) repeat protein